MPLLWDNRENQLYGSSNIYIYFCRCCHKQVIADVHIMGRNSLYDELRSERFDFTHAKHPSTFALLLSTSRGQDEMKINTIIARKADKIELMTLYEVKKMAATPHGSWPSRDQQMLAIWTLMNDCPTPVLEDEKLWPRHVVTAANVDKLPRSCKSG